MKIRVLAVAIVIGCAVIAPSWAQEGYVGASYLDARGEVGSGETFDTSSNGWKLFGGYNVVPYFGVEFTYYDLGSFSETQGSSSIRGDIDALDLSGRGILPLGKRFELFARLGISSVAVDTTTTSGSAVPVTVSASSRDWELMYGIGAAVKIGKRFGIRAEWENWNVETSLSAYSLGVFFRFGG